MNKILTSPQMNFTPIERPIHGSPENKPIDAVKSMKGPYKANGVRKGSPGNKSTDVVRSMNGGPVTAYTSTAGFALAALRPRRPAQ